MRTMNRACRLFALISLVALGSGCGMGSITAPSSSAGPVLPPSGVFQIITSLGPSSAESFIGRFDADLVARGGVGSPVAPAAPTNLTASVSGSTVTISWTAAGGNPTSYVIEAGSSPGAANLANFDTGGTTSSYSAPGVPAGTYYVRIRSRNADGVSGPSNEVIVTVSGGGSCTAPPGAPTNFTASVNGNTVTVSWQAPAGIQAAAANAATSYILEAGSTAGASNLFNSDVGNNTSLSATAPPGTYYLRVRAKNACGTSAPSNEATATVTAGGPVTITFTNLRGHGSPFGTYTESGFTVSSTSGSWTVSTSYGNPAPFIQFHRLAAEGTITAEIRITAGGSAFSFNSVDIYSSITTIPYVFTALLNSNTVFTVAATVPNTFGRFATVLNPNSSRQIDTLLIRLSNPSTPCCPNPVGLDNIAVAQ